jgi:hypothetical protein
MVSTITDRIAGSVDGQPVSLGGIAIIQCTSVSGTNTVLADTSPTIGSYITNQYFSIRPANNNTGNVDVNFQSKGLKNLLTPSGAELVADQFNVSNEYLIKYNGTEFRIVAPF